MTPEIDLEPIIRQMIADGVPLEKGTEAIKDYLREHSAEFAEFARQVFQEIYVHPQPPISMGYTYGPEWALSDLMPGEPSVFGVNRLSVAFYDPETKAYGEVAELASPMQVLKKELQAAEEQVPISFPKTPITFTYRFINRDQFNYFQRLMMPSWWWQYQKRKKRQAWKRRTRR